MYLIYHQVSHFQIIYQDDFEVHQLNHGDSIVSLLYLILPL